jgi:gas vesicle protein
VRMRSIIILTTGAAGAAAALVASPGTYEWLRRATGRASDRHHYESDTTEVEYADVDLGDEAQAETDDLRLSLRARLAESAGDVEAANSDASTGEGVAEDVDEIAASRARVRAKAREARAKISDAE